MNVEIGTEATQFIFWEHIIQIFVAVWVNLSSIFSTCFGLQQLWGLRMRSSLVVRASDCQCTCCNGPGFDPSIRRHSGIWGAAGVAVLNIVRTKKKKIPPKNILKKLWGLLKETFQPILLQSTVNTLYRLHRLMCILEIKTSSLRFCG